MKKIALLTLLWLPLAVFSQRDSSNAHMIAKLNIATPFDVFYFPTIDLSLEHRLGKRFSLSGEAGYQVYRFTVPDTSFVNSGGYKLKGEFRFYQPFAFLRNNAPSKDPLTGFYTGLNFFYRAEKHNSAVAYTQKNDTTVYTDYFWLDKSAFGGNLVFGYQEIYWGRLAIDGFIGIGLLNRNVKYNELQFDEAEGDEQTICNDLDCFFAARDLSETSGNAASFTVGFRIGYVIY